MIPIPIGGNPIPPPPLIHLYHGTDAASANAIIANGLDAAAAAAFNGSGEFWATKDQTTADWFAMTNPANGQPARLEFDLPLPIFVAGAPCDTTTVLFPGSSDAAPRSKPATFAKDLRLFR